jgi:succinate dehydrogenase / fumarate reductase iron-sulfur subunit
MKVRLEIQRFNPETDMTPFVKAYVVEVEPTDRVLDALMQVKRCQDGTLAFRKSCAHGVCGSDAMRINGKDRLACKTLIRDVADEADGVIRIEPLRFFRVERDLIVNHAAFFKKHRTVKPYFINDEPVAEKERVQTEAERAKYEDATNCILCTACFSACPVIEKNPEFLGPAIITQAERFLDDSRDRGFEARLPALDTPNGIWPCENHFECTKACPREIKITKLINLTKRSIQKYREDRGENINDEKNE